MGTTWIGVQSGQRARMEALRSLGYWSATTALVTWSAMGVESVLRPFQDNRRENFWPLPFLCTVVAFTCVHLLHKGRSRTERFGFAMMAIASGLMLLGNLGLQLNIKPLERLQAPMGPLIWFVGLVCFGVGILVADVMPKYAGWAVILLEPSSVLTALALSPIAPLLPRGAYSGNVGKGIALGIVAIALQRMTLPRDLHPA